MGSRIQRDLEVLDGVSVHFRNKVVTSQMTRIVLNKCTPLIPVKFYFRVLPRKGAKQIQERFNEC